MDNDCYSWDGANGSQEVAFGNTVMIRFGARISYKIVDEGEVWRLWAAAFIHASEDHITGNLVAILPFIYICEMVMGKFATLAIYMLAAAGGSLVPSVLGSYWSVGASGSVLGFIGATTSIFIVNKSGMRPETCFVIFAPLMVSSYFQLVGNLAAIGGTTDVLAHLGGYVFGMLTGNICCPVLAHDGIKVDYEYAAKVRAVSAYILAGLTALLVLGMWVIRDYELDAFEWCYSL